jgi:hypothetical protein
MANRISYNPAGFIDVVIEGDQTYMSFENLLPDATDLLEQLKAEGRPRLGLIDVSRQGAFSVGSNRSAMETLESLDYERLAIFGAGRILNEVIKAIVLAMDKTHNTKIFNDRESAIAWLMDGGE